MLSIRNRNILLACSLATAMQLMGQEKPPDNTRNNKHDQGVTADKQGNSKADVDLAKNIRKAITSDKGMSTYAKNIKVITNNGNITLKGPVRSEEEKSTVLSKAREAAGGSNITDEITVAPPK